MTFCNQFNYGKSTHVFVASDLMAEERKVEGGRVGSKYKMGFFKRQLVGRVAGKHGRVGGWVAGEIR